MAWAHVSTRRCTVAAFSDERSTGKDTRKSVNDYGCVNGWVVIDIVTLCQSVLRLSLFHFGSRPCLLSLGSSGDAVGSSGETLGNSRHALGSSGDALGSSGDALGSSGEALGSFGHALGSIGNALGSSGNALGSSGDALGSSGHALRTPWKALGMLCGPLGTLWGALGKLWGSSGEALGKLWEALGTLWGRSREHRGQGNKKGAAEKGHRINPYTSKNLSSQTPDHPPLAAILAYLRHAS